MASEKIEAMIEEIKGLTVLELSELVHALEETFGVSAAAAAAPAAAGAAAPAAEEKTEFDVVLTSSGPGRGKGPCRERSGCKDQRSSFQGRCRRDQGKARSSWRNCRTQVIYLQQLFMPYYLLVIRHFLRGDFE